MLLRVEKFKKLPETKTLVTEVELLYTSTVIL